MEKTIKKLKEAQLCNLISNITKQYIMESMGLGSEVGEDQYEMEQDYFNNPDSDGTPIDDLGDDEFYDDFFENPAEESFSDNETIDTPSNGEIDDYDALLESKEKEDLSEKQTKLLTYITENWDNHANNLIK